MSLTVPADFPDALVEAVGPTFRNKSELKSVHPQFYKRKPNLLRELELSQEEKMDILGRKRMNNKLWSIIYGGLGLRNSDNNTGKLITKISGRLAFEAGIQDEVNEVLSNVKDEL